MTVQQGHIVQGQAGRWSVPVRRRDAVARRSRSAAEPVRLSFRLVVAVVLEAIVLAGVVQLSIGLGYEGQAGHQPAPAAAPSYESVPAPLPDEGRLLAAAPLPAPAPLAAPPPPLP